MEEIVGRFISILEERHKISPNTVAQHNGRKNKEATPIDVAELMRSPVDLFNSQYKEEDLHRPVTIAFKDAVQLVLDTIIANMRIANKEGLEGKEVPVQAATNTIAYWLLTDLSRIDVDRTWRVPDPPRYDGLVCNASPSDNRFWLGAILSMLYDSGMINAYGKTGTTFWAAL